jgi:flagellar motor switch protein FliG
MTDLMDRTGAAAARFADPSLVGARKVAVVIASLGTEAGARVLAQFAPQEVMAIIREVKDLQSVPQDEVRTLLGRLREEAEAQTIAVSGGFDRARDLLRKSHGAEADQILETIMAATVQAPFQFLRSHRPDQVIQYLSSEHPQVIALVLSHLPLSLAARVMEGLDAATRADVAARFATLENADPDVVAELEQVLARRVGWGGTAETAKALGGVKPLAQMLNSVARETEKAVIEALEKVNPTLASEVRELMFVFEDLVSMDDRSMQEILRAADARTIALALRDAPGGMKEKIEKNLSQRAAEAIDELTEGIGQVRRTEVEQAQQEVVRVARRLEEAGQIVLVRGESGGGGDFV